MKLEVRCHHLSWRLVVLAGIFLLGSLGVLAHAVAFTPDVCDGCEPSEVTSTNSGTGSCAIVCFKSIDPFEGVCFYAEDFDTCVWTNCTYDYTITCCISGTNGCTRICASPPNTPDNDCDVAVNEQQVCKELTGTVLPECGDEATVSFYVGAQTRTFHFPCTTCE